MNIFDPHITGSLSVSASANIQGDLIVGGTIYGTAQISGQVQESVSASHAASYVLTSSFENYTSSAATTGSNTFVGDQTIRGSLLPQDTLTHDIGSDAQRWRDIYLAGNTINLGGTKITKNDDGDVEFKDSSDNLKKVIASEVELGRGTDKVIIRKDNNGKIKINNVDNTDGEISLSGSFTGSFVGDGSRITNVPASAVQGLSLNRIADGAVTASIGNGKMILNANFEPDLTDTRDLGSPTKQWRDLFLSSGSLYINGQQVLSTTGNELRITTNDGESIKIIETGSDTITLQTENGDITLTSSGNGNIELDGPIQIGAGNKILSSDGNSIVFGNGLIITGSIVLSGTVDGVDVASLKSDVDAILAGSSADKNSFAEIVSLINSVDTTNDQSFASFYTASNNRFTSIESTTSSFDGRIDSLETKTGSLDGQISTINSLNTTQNGRLSSLETKTGSLDSDISGLDGRLDSLETQSGSIRTTFNSYTSSNNTTNTTQNSRLSFLETKTGSLETTNTTQNSRLSFLETKTGSLNSDISTLDGRVDLLELESGSIRSDFNDYVTTTDLTIGNLAYDNGVLDGRIDSLEITSGSHKQKISSLETESGSVRTQFNSYTSSNNDKNSEQDNRLNRIENFTGSYTTGSFTGSFNGDGGGLTNIPASGVTGLNLTQIADGSVTASVSNTNGLRVNSKTEITGSLLVDGNLNTLSLRGYNSLFGTPSSVITNFTVTVVSKSSNHRYFNIGSGLGYHIDGVESPFLTLLPGKTYRFNQDDSSNSTHQLLFYLDAAKTTQYTTNVTTNGTAGNEGSYTQIIVTDITPIILHYQCINHGYMGNSAQFNSNVTSFNNLTDKPTLVSGSSQIDITDTTGYDDLNGRVTNLETFEDEVNGGLEFTGSNVTIKGNLLVKGTETIVNSTTIEVSDNIISLNGSGAANAGIEVRDVTSPGVLSGSLIWDGLENQWKGGTKGAEERILLERDLTTLDGRLDSLETQSGSIRTTFNSYTSSNNTTNTTQNSRLSSLESATGSYTTTDYYTTGATFDNTTGVIRGTRNDGGSWTVDIDGRYLQSHPTIVSATSSNNSGRTYIQDILLDSNGHVTGLTTATETVVNTDTIDYVSDVQLTENILRFTSVGRGFSGDIDLSQFIDNTNTFLTGATFNASNGVVTLTKNDGTTVTVDIDGRYLQSYTESDPIFTSSASYGITDTNITNWDEAYGWGDHSTRGYLTTYNNEYTTGATFSTSTGVITFTRNDGDTFTVDIDGRFLTSYTEVDTLATVTSRGATTSSKVFFTHNATTDPLSAVEINGGGTHTGLYINPAAGSQAHVRFGTDGTLKWQIRAPFQNSSDTSLNFYSWVSGADKFQFQHSGNAIFNGGTVWTSANDGAESGLNADLLDGNHASAFYLATNPSGYQTAAQVATAVSGLVDSAPATLDTLNELAAALGDDPNFATTVSTNIGTKVSKSGDTMTGNLTMGSNLIYGDGATRYLNLGGTPAELVTVRSMEIRADDDDSSNSEYLKLMAGQNTLQITSTLGGGTDNTKITYNGNTIWHAGNDGSGSGLDADLLDGNHASAFALSGHTHIISTINETDVPPAGVSIQSGPGGGNNQGWAYPYGTRLSAIVGGGRSFEIMSTTYPNGELAMRTLDGSNIWDEWKIMLDANNYSSYAATKTGGNTSGTWPISITGNADSATTATNLSGLGSIQSTSTGTSYTDNYQVKENSGGGSNTNEIYAPQLAFHWSGVVASSIMMESSGRIAIRNNPGGSYENFAAAVITATGGNSTKWNDAFSWGNHADFGYITGYTETDTLATVTGRGATTTENVGVGSLDIASGGLITWVRTYPVSNTVVLPLLNTSGNNILTGGAYRVTAHIDGTGTDQSSKAVFWNQNGTWYLNETSRSGVSSNHIQFLINSNVPSVKTFHANTYSVRVLHEWINLYEGTGTDNTKDFWGTDAYMSNIDGNVRFNNGGNVIVPAGNVGIGTTSPSEKLHVAGRIMAAGSGYTLNPTAPIFGQYAPTRGYVQVPTNGQFEIWNGGTSEIATFYENRNSVFHGNVGIGTTSPTYKLYVEGSVNGEFRAASFVNTNTGTGAYGEINVVGNDATLRIGITNTNYGGQWTGGGAYFLAPGGMFFGPGGSYSVSMLANGNVGIGTLSPSTLLHVNGVITATGGNSTNWNTAYGWGDHAGRYMLEGLTLSDIDTIRNGGNRYDPSVSNPTNEHYAVLTYGNRENVTGQLATHFVTGNLYSRGYNSSWSTWRRYWNDTDFTSTNVSNWNTAYGWGNHASAGYLTDYVNTFTTGSTFNSSNGIITFTRNDGNTFTVDISATLSEVSVTGGTYNSSTRILTLTKSDNTSIDVSGFAIDTDVNWYTTGATFSTSTGVITGTRNNGGTWTVDIDGRFLPLGGGTMTSTIGFNTTGTGLEWSMNTDSAYIKFYNTGDGDTDSRLEYGTSDNGNEYHRWMIATVEEMTLKSDGLRVRDSIWMGGNLVATESWVSGRGYLTTHPTIAGVSSNNSGRTYIQDVLTDSNGHVTGLTTATETVVNTDTNTVTSVGISGDLSTGNITLVGAGATTVTKSGGTITITSTDTNTDTNIYTTGATFNSGNGIITFTRSDNNAYLVDIDGKYAESSHTHTISNVTGLQTALDGKQAAGNYLTSFTETNTFLGDGGNANTHPGTSRLIFTGQVSQGTGVLGMPTTDNSNAFLNINRHPGEYNSQLGFSSNGNMYYRSFSATGINSTQAWRTVWDSGNFDPNSKANSSHTHTIANVTGLQTELNEKLSIAGGTLTGQVIFPSAATTKPVLPNGFISRNDLGDTSGRHDIWGISERHYPSNTTAGEGWGIQWSGTPNDIVFVGGSTDRVTISLDEGNITSLGTVTASGGNSTNWNTAYGWGNHASAGYLTSFDITTQTDSKYLRSDIEDTTRGSLIIESDWNNGTYAESFTIYGTFPSMAFRSTNADSGTGGTWLIHMEGDGDLTWYSSTDGPTDNWTKRMELQQGGVLQVNGNTVYHTGNLTNLNQLTNGPGYITSYSETDTLATVTSRGGTTTTALTINANEGLKVTYDGTGGDTWLRGWGIESNRGSVYLRPTTNNSQNLYVGYSEGNISWNTVSIDASALDWNGSTLLTSENIGSYALTSLPAHTHTISNVTGLQTALDGKQAAGSYLTTSGKAADSNLLDGIDSSGFQRQIDESIVNIGTPNASSGTWTVADTDDWGTPRIGSIAARYNDGTGYLQFNVPAGMDSAYVSHLTWSAGGYVDCYGVQADGGLVFLRRINTRQSIENINEGSNGGNPNQHDGTTISLVGTGLSTFSAVRLQNRVGRFHLTGMSFTSAKLQGTEGTGMVHPGQLSISGSGSGLDADLLDGNHASAFALSSHTHTIANVTGLQTALDAKAASSHTHTIANVTGLQTALDGKAASSHTHTIANVTGLQDAIDGKQAAGSYLTTSGKAADSNLLDGLDLHTGRNNEVNKVVRTDANGYIQAGWINTTSGDGGTTAITRIYASNDEYVRFYTPANFISVLGLITTGNIGSQSVTTATNLGADYTANDWFRATADNNPVKFYGNTHQITWRTDGVTEAYSGIGGHPFVWTYGGSSASDRRMLMDTSGNLWTNTYGWLHDYFQIASTAITTSNIASQSVSVARQLLSPNNADRVAADDAMPNAGHSFIHTLALGPGNNDGHILGMTWANTTSSYGAQIFIDTDPNDIMAIRSRSAAGVWTSWKTIIHSGNIGSQSVASATNSTQLNGQSASYYTNAANLTGTIGDVFASTTRYNIGLIDGNGSQTRDKIRVWDSAEYTIGMKVGYSFGWLGKGTDGYAMSFQMSDTTGRGFWWGDSSHGDSQGAMSLTTDGKATIATSLSIGEGESMTAPSSTTLYVYGSTSGATVFDVQGTSGQLFSVTDDLTGTIFAASDISGIPILEVDASGIVTVDGILRVTEEVIAYYSSDERLKKNIKPIENPLEKLKLISGNTFEWDDTNPIVRHSGKDIGVIAQEIEKVLPEIVAEKKGGYKGVQYEKIVALLIESNKALLERVEELESKLK